MAVANPAAPDVCLGDCWCSGPPTSRDGNPSWDEAVELMRLAYVLRAESIFEIGTGNGSTAIALAGLPNRPMVFSLDLPQGADPILPIDPTDRLWIGQEKLPFPPNVIQLTGDSAAFDDAAFRGGIEMVLIMGAHSEAYIANDIALASFLVIPCGGIIVLHAGTAAGMSKLPAGWSVRPITDRMGILWKLSID